MPNSIAYDVDEWAPLRVRMRVFLDELEANAEGVSCLEQDCPSTAEFRAAVEVIRRHIDAIPVVCEHVGFESER